MKRNETIYKSNFLILSLISLLFTTLYQHRSCKCSPWHTKPFINSKWWICPDNVSHKGRDPLSELDHQIISNRRGLKLNITKKWNVIQFPYLRFHMQKSNIDVLSLLSNIIKIIKGTHDCFTCLHANRLHLLLANSKAVSPCRET